MRYRKYGYGGYDVDPSVYQVVDNEATLKANGNSAGMANTIGGYAKAGQFTSSVLQDVAPDTKAANYGGGMLSGAAAGAALGTEILPGWGTAVGAAVGAIGGYFGASAKEKSQQKARQQAFQAKQQALVKQQSERQQSVMANYSTSGNSAVQSYYKYGGRLKMPDGGQIPRPTFYNTTGSIMQVQKADGSIGNWGNDFTNTPPRYRLYPHGDIGDTEMTYLRSVNDPNLNIILNRNIAKQGEMPLYGAEDSDVIKAMLAKRQLPSGQQIQPSTPHLAEGGAIPSAPNLTGQGSTTQLASDTHQFNGPSHANGGIPIDTTGNGVANAEVEGNEVQKGNQIYSDRLSISPMLNDILKNSKVKLPANATYAEVAAKLGKLKGKFESNVLHSPVSIRTNKAMVNRYDGLLQQTFADQEQSKVPQFAYGGKLPQFPDGGIIDPYKAKLDAINKQLANYNANYQRMIATGNAQKLSTAQQQARDAGIAKMNEYRKHLQDRLADHTEEYQKAANTFDTSVKQYNPNTRIHNRWVGAENPNDAKAEVDKKYQTVSQGLEMLKRLDPSKVDFTKPNWENQIGIDASNFGGSHFLKHDYYLGLSTPPTSSNTTTIPKVVPPIIKPPTVNSAGITVTSTPPVHATTPISKSGNGRYTPAPLITRQPQIETTNTLPINTNLQATTLPTNIAIAPLAVTTSGQPTAPSFMSGLNNGIDKYGADAINLASLIGNQNKIAGMSAPTFTYNPAPNYNYIDRSQLAKYENAVATKNMQKGVVNTSSQGSQAQQSGIFAQNLNSNNEINNNENQRYDAYNRDYNARAGQVDQENVGIANKQSDVTTQVSNDKIAMGIQAQNAFNQGEIQNTATRSQQDLDEQKAAYILAGTQDPDKAAAYLGSMNPAMRKRVQALSQRKYN